MRQLRPFAISTTTVGASIRYTTDGSTPSSTVGTVYSGPMLVTASTTLKAIAYLAGWTNSVVNSAAYTIGSANKYSYRRPVTINHALVPNTDQSSFPFLMNTTDPLLKTAGNGGHVMNASGYDIIFSSDSAGTQKLDYEIESYSGATGQLVAWVRIPILSHVSDTVIYMLYGNSTITASQENKSGVWSGGYTSVYHMADNSTNKVLTDSTGHHSGTSLATTNAKSTAGQIGAALSFDGATDYDSIVDTADLQSNIDRTVSMWVKPSDLSGTTSYRILCEYTDANNQWSIVAESAGNADFNTIRADIRVANSYTQFKIADNSIASGSFYHLVVVYNNTVPGAIYLNGVSLPLIVPKQGPLGFGSTSRLTIGARNDFSRTFPGILDEVRIATVVRSADWIKTEYNNQANPAAFYTIGTEVLNAALIDPQPFPATVAEIMMIESRRMA